jgi:hypothetical protein
VFAASALYRRRGYTDDRNPWGKEAERLSVKLSRIGQGLEPLTPGADRAEDSVSIIVEQAKTYPGERLIV